MRSFINNGKVHNWNLTKEDLDAIAKRPNYKYEEYFDTEEQATEIAKHRSMGTWKRVTVWSTAEGPYVVCTHGVQKIGWKPIVTYIKGNQI